jgi:hypothetical protein
MNDDEFCIGWRQVRVFIRDFAEHAFHAFHTAVTLPFVQARPSDETTDTYGPSLKIAGYEVIPVNCPDGSARGLRGGLWFDPENFLRSSGRFDSVPAFGNSDVGFRVASVPEPTVIGMLSVGALLLWRWRKRS